MIGKECKSSFTYLGLSIDQTESHIIINLNTYSQSTETIALNKDRMNQKEFPVSNEELKKLRMLVGQINCVATQTRPDL